MDRVRAVQPEFQMTRESAAAVAELCRRLEGLPLALELAAARASVLTPQQMLKRLATVGGSETGARFELLRDEGRHVALRHRSLRATLDWSYHLLSREQRRSSPGYRCSGADGRWKQWRRCAPRVVEADHRSWSIWNTFEGALWSWPRRMFRVGECGIGCWRR